MYYAEDVLYRTDLHCIMLKGVLYRTDLHFVVLKVYYCTDVPCTVLGTEKLIFYTQRKKVTVFSFSALARSHWLLIS